MGMFFNYKDNNLNGIPDNQEREQEIYKRKLFKVRNSKKLINPWSEIINEKLLTDPNYLRKKLKVNNVLIDEYSQIMLNHV